MLQGGVYENEAGSSRITKRYVASMMGQKQPVN
jgi:hypothetical protein